MSFGRLIQSATTPAQPRQIVARPRTQAQATHPGSPAETPRRPIALTKPILHCQHVSKMVAQADARPSISRSGGSDGYIHVSSLIGGCAREQCISRQHGLPVAKSPGGPMRLVWRLGRAAEKHVRDSVIESREYQGIYGRWVCKCEADSYTGMIQIGRTCAVCNKPTANYREPPLRHDGCKVIGSPDLTLVEMGWFLPVEIKSMNKEQFDDLSRPLHDHILQACCYHWLYDQLGFQMMGKVVIIYARKDFKFGGSLSIYKEYHVDFEDYAYQVERLMATAQAIYAHNEEGSLPDRICNAATHSRAKGCERGVLCFSL